MTGQAILHALIRTIPSCILFTLIMIDSAYGLPLYQVTSSLVLGTEYTDNTLRAPADSNQGEASILPGVTLAVDTASAKINAGLDYRINRIDYQRDLNVDRTDILGQGQATWQVLANRLDWSISQLQQRLTLDNFQPETPGNETNRSVWQTGPSLRFNLSPVDTLRINAQYANSRFESGRSTNSEYTDISLAWQHRVSRITNLALSTKYSDAMFDQRGLDYTRRQVDLTLSGIRPSASYEVQLGQNTIERDSGASVRGLFYSLTYDYEYQNITLGIQANHELTDSSVGLSRSVNQSSGFATNDSNFNRQDIVVRTQVLGRYTATTLQDRMQVSVSINYSKQDYDTILFDEKTIGVTIGLHYQIMSSMSVDLSYTQDRRSFLDRSPVDRQDNRAYRAQLSTALGRRTTFSTWVRMTQRRFDIEATDYDEFRVGLTLFYRLTR